MINECEEYKSAEELREEIAELKIRLAFQEQFEEEVEEILAECENPDPELLRVIDQEEERLLNEIAQQCQKRSSKRSPERRKFLRSTTSRVATLVIVGMLISISSAMAAIQMMRAGVFALDIAGDNRRMSIRMVQTEAAAIPEGWMGDYYPTYIPDGFEFVSSYSDGYNAMYFNKNGDWISFSESKSASGTSIDTENAKISYVEINGTDAIVIEKEQTASVIWEIDDRYFVVIITGEKRTAIQIAASVVMTK